MPNVANHSRSSRCRQERCYACRRAGKNIETWRQTPSPRGGQTLILAGKVRALTQGRFNVSFDDIQAAAAAALRHRLILNFEAEAEGITTDHIVRQILQDVPKDAQAVNA